MAKRGQTTAEMIRTQKRLAIGGLLIGVLALLAGAHFFLQDRQFNASAAHATGKIVELTQKKSGDSVRFFPVFTFVDTAGVAHRLQSKIGWNPPHYAVGETVEVLYSPNDPEEAKLNDFLSVWTWPAILGGGGLIFVIAGIVLWHGAITWPVKEGSSPGEEI